MKNLRFKWVLRRDNIQGIFRLFRIMWERGDVGFDASGYSTKFSVALSPGLLAWQKQGSSIEVTLLGLRFHRCRSYGGVFG